MKSLAWEKVVPIIFFGALTVISSYIGYTLQDLNKNISQLNIQMGSVVERIAVTSKDNESIKSKQDEQTKVIYSHEGRIQSLERGK